MLSSFSESLVKAFVSMLRSNVADNEQSAYVYCGVKGLQILATFPGSFTPVSKAINDSIFFELVAIITSDSNKTVVWKSALKALVEIGFSIEKCLDSEKAASFESTVVEKIVSLISSLDSAIPLSLRLEAAFEIGATRKDFMLRVVRGLDEAIDTNFSAVFDHGNHKSNELTIKLLDTYSQKVLPWFLEIGGSEEVQLNFALSIWDKIENFRSLNLSLPEFASDLLGAMTAMKKAVGSCSEESQEIIINKASGVLFSSTVFGSMGFKSGSSILKEEGLQQTQNYVNSSGRDEWLTSLFASVVVALRPQTGIPNGKMILQLFITSLLNGHVPSAHALGSLVNKLPLETKGIESSRRLILNEALDMIFYSFVGTCRDDSTSGNDGSGVNISSLRLNTSRIQSEINTVIGLAWIGKGLLMRGHEKVKDITMTLLSFLTLDCEAGVSKHFQNLVEVLDEEGVHQLMKCAGDAFHIIMSDSGECLNLKSESSFVRSMLYRAFAHVVSDTPLTAILGEAKKLFPILLECLSTLSKDVSDKGIIYSVLLVISGILLDKNGQEAAVENASSIVNQLIELTAYPHMMAVRELAIQCLVAVSELPHARVYPLRTKIFVCVCQVFSSFYNVRFCEPYPRHLMIQSELFVKRLSDVGKLGLQLHQEVFTSKINEGFSNTKLVNSASCLLARPKSETKRAHKAKPRLRADTLPSAMADSDPMSSVGIVPRIDNSRDNIRKCRKDGRGGAESLQEDVHAPTSQAQPEEIERKARVDAVWQQMNKGVSAKTLKSILENQSAVANKPRQKNPGSKSSTGWKTYLGLGLKKTPSPEKGVPEKCPSISQNGASEDAKKLAAAALSAVKDAAAAAANAGRGKVEAAEKGKGAAGATSAVDAVLEQIKKKPKLSVLDKTKKDWGEFKEENKGMEDELDAYKKSSNQYLDKVSFLQRADYREFERERDARLALQAKRRTEMRDDL
ncbi:MMS19 nucleotide excision repair protein [Sesamum angolense]|uniref:MMS19 nucleotide excision repair protein n=1 Tax=Sesamum angolense TaxID=2727404 RepID=A0AAE1WKV5_9LAMI|nr:MMS19 nucleotide excision repair protein [Sesamum angolense]